MKYLYIIDTTNAFAGSILNHMPYAPKGERDNIIVPYQDQKTTFKEYNKLYNGKLIAMTWEEFNEDFYKEHLLKLQKPFEEIEEDDFFYMFECLPPVRYTNLGGLEYFFISEAYTQNLHTLCISAKGKYFKALRPVNMSHNDIVKESKTVIK